MGVARVARAVAARRPRVLPFRRWMREAAVAIVVREGSGGAELLLIRRERRPGDPWSGHMAFPGGKVDAGDADALAAARREAREEVAVDLGRSATLLGPLSPILATTHDRRRPMAIAPFVFALAEDVALEPQPGEVAEALWAPLAFFEERRHRERMSHPLFGLPWRWPAYRYEGRVVWGLTLRMLDDLLARLRRT